jgi:hypothetical protein
VCDGVVRHAPFYFCSSTVNISYDDFPAMNGKACSPGISTDVNGRESEPAVSRHGDYGGGYGLPSLAYRHRSINKDGNGDACGSMQIYCQISSLAMAYLVVVGTQIQNQATNTSLVVPVITFMHYCPLGAFKSNSCTL